VGVPAKRHYEMWCFACQRAMLGKTNRGGMRSFGFVGHQGGGQGVIEQR
jgi:hypothetical protein